MKYVKSVPDSLVILLIVVCCLVLTAVWFWLHVPWLCVALWCPRVEILWMFVAVVCQCRWTDADQINVFRNNNVLCYICIYRQMEVHCSVLFVMTNVLKAKVGFRILQVDVVLLYFRHPDLFRVIKK